MRVSQTRRMTGDEYLARAEEMLKRAEQAATAEERLEHMFLASGWENLAEAHQRAATKAALREPDNEP